MDASTNFALLFAGFALGVIFWQWGNIKKWADDDSLMTLVIIVCLLIISFGLAMGIFGIAAGIAESGR